MPHPAPSRDPPGVSVWVRPGGRVLGLRPRPRSRLKGARPQSPPRPVGSMVGARQEARGLRMPRARSARTWRLGGTSSAARPQDQASGGAGHGTRRAATAWTGSGSSAGAAGSGSAGTRTVRQPARGPDPAGRLGRGVRPRRRRPPGPATSARTCSPRRSSRTGRRNRSAASCRRSPAARSCGARATANPAPARTWPAIRTTAVQPRAATGRTGSPARRSGPRSPTRPTGASCWPARSRGPRRHHGLSFLLVPMDQPGRDRGPSDPADDGDERVQRGVLRRGARRAPSTWSAARATAGGSP